MRPVVNGRDLKRFIDLPYRLHARDPIWVPPLRYDIETTLSRTKNPYFEHADAEYFLAGRGREVVGRITAQVDRLAKGDLEAHYRELAKSVPLGRVAHASEFGDVVAFLGGEGLSAGCAVSTTSSATRTSPYTLRTCPRTGSSSIRHARENDVEYWEITQPALARMPTVPSADPSGPSYDQISAQLKRDLLRQRERIGDVLGDLPWA